MAWEDAPAHVCKGGDARGLAFCCPPVKPCPIHAKLTEIGLSPEEFIKIKQDFGSRTPLGQGAATCFGSLIWCCKASKPCPLRDSQLQQAGISHDEYMDLKKQLADKILEKANIQPSNTYSDEELEQLSTTFNISKDEAKTALEEAGNDLKTAVKKLRLKNL